VASHRHGTVASWIVERVSAEDSANRAATAAQIDELRDEVRHLSRQLSRRPGDRQPDDEHLSYDEDGRAAWAQR